jgi:hypothetical protein
MENIIESLLEFHVLLLPEDFAVPIHNKYTDLRGPFIVILVSILAAEREKIIRYSNSEMGCKHR